MKKTLVIGASLNEYRYSNMAIRSLVDHNINVMAIGLRKGIVAGVNIELGEPDFQDIDTVTLYLNAQRQEQYYDYIISLLPNRVIFNPGAENFEFAKLLEKQNIQFENTCTLVLLSTGQY